MLEGSQLYNSPQFCNKYFIIFYKVVQIYIVTFFCKIVGSHIMHTQAGLFLRKDYGPEKHCANRT
jgi:hypothetical protein